jgi:tRNA dimethylallyltransferase
MKLLILGGPTASGKSALALQLARDLKQAGQRAEIICCDSITIYRGFDIGSAKPSLAEQQEIPHHLLDIADPTESFTAGDFIERTAPLLQRLLEENTLAIVTGGTGFYLRALLRGMATGEENPQISEERKLFWEKEGQSKGWQSLWAEVKRRDPHSEIHENDHYRLVRALQAMDLTNKPWSELVKEARAKPPLYPHVYYYLQPTRDELRARVKKRTEVMLSSGLLAEVEKLLAAGVPKTCKPMQSVGYKECVQFIEGALASEATLAAAIEQNTMRLAKQQATWFRGEELATELPQTKNLLEETLRFFENSRRI